MVAAGAAQVTTLAVTAVWAVWRPVAAAGTAATIRRRTEAVVVAGVVGEGAGMGLATVGALQR